MVVLLPFLLLLVGIVAVTAFDLLRRRNLRRMALRNIARRPIEALLVVGGASLGTAIITSAFVAGDTFDASIGNIARTDLGPVDETIAVDDVSQLDAVVEVVAEDPPADTDGVLAFTGAVAAVRAGDHAEPLTELAELDFDAARAFGDDPAATGLVDAGSTPAGDEAVVSRHLADELALSRGDELEVFAYGEQRVLTVRTIAPRLGLGGFADVYLAPGSLAELAGSQTGTEAGATTAEPPYGLVLVSNTGGVFDGADHTTAVTRALEDRLAGTTGVEVSETKQDLLDDAESNGNEMSSMFSALGTFSIAAGVLLLVNLFVMLAEERKSELGVLRAVGMKRNHLVRLFGLEGAFYAVAAAALGVLIGIGVGWVIVRAVASIIADEEDDITFVFDLRPASLVTGALAGLAISLATVWGTSFRIARLNVIRAIRELPEPPVRRASWWKMVLGAVGIVLGGLIFNTGLSGDSAVPVLIGPALAVASAVPLVGRLLPRRAVIAVAAAFAGIWSVVALEVVPDAFEDADIEMFVVQGLLLVGAGVALGAQGDRAWAWVADRLADRGGLASRLAVAYPLARRVRTAMLLAMFALITFMLTFMSSLNEAQLAAAPQTAADASFGWDLWVDSSPTNPVTPAELTEDEDITETSPLVVGGAELVRAGQSDEDPDLWPVTGFESSLLGPGLPKLSERLDRYDDNRTALEAVLADPTLAIGSDWLLEDEGGPGGGSLEVGDKIVATNPATGEDQTFTLVGLTDEDWSDFGLLVGQDAAAGLLGDRAVPSRVYVQVAPGADPDTVADRLEAAHVTTGVEATSFEGAVEEEMREFQGFIRLLQGYLGLGLIIGIAGLGVVMVRAVRERRRQIGMLRAIGFPAPVVRRSFMAEAGFVAIQGILLGIGLGLITSYQMLTSDVFDDPLPFEVPWLALVVLFAVPAAAAFAAAYAPAAQASRIQPAAALRTAD